MKRSIWSRALTLVLVFACLVSVVGAANLLYDHNGDGKTNVWDLMKAPEEDQPAALEEALGGYDELHKNAQGEWEIWTSLGLYHMAELAQSGDTFVLMQDIDLDGAWWKPIADFNGKLIGNQYTISNMLINKSVDGNMGFFGLIAEGGYVECLNLSDMNVIADENTTTIGLMAATCAGTIDGCTTIGFVTDERTALPSDVYVGGMAGKMVGHGQIISRDVNKLPEVGVEQAINTISSQIGTRFAVQSGHIVGIVGDGQNAVDSGTLLQDLTGILPDPNAIAWVTTGDNTVYVHTVQQIIDAIDPSGNSVVTLQQDISFGQAIQLPYTCTFDCNGYTVATPATKNNGFQIKDVGTENVIFTLKNGTLTHYEIGVYAGQAAVVISDMVIVSEGGAPLGLYSSSDYSALNRIENSTLVSKNWVVLTYNKADVDMSLNGITIENSNLIAGKSAGAAVFSSRTTLPGTVTLGNNVNIYTCSDTFTSTVQIDGLDPVKLDGAKEVTVLGKTYTGLNCWTTDEEMFSKEVIAEVTNGSETIQVTNVNDMTKAVAADGNTKIKLLKDITRTSQISIPYSCEIDLNDFSITVSSGNALRLSDVGTENTVTTIKNGTISHSNLGIRVDTGSLDLNNVELYGLGNSGSSIAYYDPSGAYKAGNKIQNCYIYNPKSDCIRFNVADVDFKDTGVKITDTTLIATKTYPFAVATSKMSGIVDLGEGVEIYSNKTAVAGSSLYRFLGLIAYRTDKTSVTVDGTEITGMNHWSTDNQKDVINILLIGNSYSTTIPQELYNIATNAGYEVNVANIYYPGCIASQHWDWLQNDVANYQYRHQSEMGNYIRRGDMSTMKYALEDMDWDVIVYQDWFPPQYKSNPDANSGTLEELYANHQEPAYNIMQYLKTNYPDAQHYYYQHWAWQIGHSTIPDVETRDAMWERVNTASTKFAEDNDFILIPCGAAFEIARLDENIGDGLYDTDKFHDGGPGGGQFLNGCVFFETIFRESCTADTTWGESSTKLADAQVAALREYAHQAVVDVHGENWVK